MDDNAVRTIVFILTLIYHFCVGLTMGCVITVRRRINKMEEDVKTMQWDIQALAERTPQTSVPQPYSLVL